MVLTSTGALVSFGAAASTCIVRAKMPLTVGSVYHPTEFHRHELLVEALSDYAIYMLDAEGFVTTWNRGAERIKGYSSDEVIGQHFSCFFSREDQANGV